MDLLKQEKGSITLFVVISMLFFVMFLTGMYMLSATAESGVIEEQARIKEIYEQGVNNIDEVYGTLENIENAKEIQNYEMLYDGNANTEEEKEAIKITAGWVDVTSNSASSYGTGARKVTKNQNSINFYAVNEGAIPSVSINRNIGSMDFYKIYTKFTGKSNTEKYTGYSISMVFLDTDPTKNKFSIYGDNDNRIDISKYGVWYKGSSYNNMILSTYKPTSENSYLCIVMSLYSKDVSSYSYSSNMQNCWIVRQDDYNQLAKIAKLEGKYDNVEKLLTQEALTQICNSEKASEYLVNKCTGDIMCELLSNDDAIGYLSREVKTEMINNKNWSKFIKIYEKQNLFE